MSAKHMRAVALSIAALTGEGHAVMAQGLDWELERSFRYFRHASDEAVHRIAFDLLKKEDRTPEQIEKLVNGGDFWSRPLPPAADRPAHWPVDWKQAATPRAIIAKMREREGRPPMGAVDARGWASLLVERKDAISQTATCWNSKRRIHDNCREHGDYVRPSYWKVRVYAVGAAPANNCTWTIEGGTFEDPKGKALKPKPTINDMSCTEVFAFVSAGTDPDKVAGRAKVSRSKDGATVESTIVVEDVLIVGMGDSITSGEGNPESGVSLLPNVITEPLNLPRRATDGWESAAQWTDRWCHRSVYSWQIRAMLQISLENRKRAVTALPYGCSGAEITEGILYTYFGVEPVDKAMKFKGHTAQMGVVYQELCKDYQDPTAFPAIPDAEKDEALPTSTFSNPGQILKDVRQHVARCKVNAKAVFRRKIDLLMLAIGINDVGFSRWVAGAFLTGVPRWLAEGFVPKKRASENCDWDCRITENRLKRLKARYEVLRRILDERLLKDGKLKAEQVITVVYPNGTQERDGETCKMGNAGMTVATLRDFEGPTHSCRGGAITAIRNSADLDTIDRFRVDGLNKPFRDFSNAGGKSFNVIDDHASRFLRRGFCASSDAQSQPIDPPCWSIPDFDTRLDAISCAQDDLHCIRRAAESLHIPRFSGNEWRPFNATEFRAYHPRTRLFRTPNDVFVLINKRNPNVLEESAYGALSFKDRASSGAMHPTAEAHAIIATSAAAVARAKLAPPP